MAATVNADDVASFRTEVLEAAGPVVVDFWAEWCAPCRLVSPELEALADESGGALKVVKVDIDANPEIAARYGIQSIPTISLFREGELVATTIGAKPKAVISADLGLS